VAYDLRFLAGALRLVTDLERIGDEAVNIAERAKEEHGTAKDKVRSELKNMGEQAQEMLRDALDAFRPGGDEPGRAGARPRRRRRRALRADHSAR